MASSNAQSMSLWLRNNYHQPFVNALLHIEHRDAGRALIVNEQEKVILDSILMEDGDKARAVWLFTLPIFSKWLQTTERSADGIVSINSKEDDFAVSDSIPSPMTLACAITHKHLAANGYLVLTWHAYLDPDCTAYDMLRCFIGQVINGYFNDTVSADKLDWIRASGLYDQFMFPTTFQDDNVIQDQKLQTVLDIWESLMNRVPHYAKIVAIVDGVDILEEHSAKEAERTASVIRIFQHTVMEKRGTKMPKGEGYPQALPREGDSGRVAYTTSEREFRVMVIAHTQSKNGHNWTNKSHLRQHKKGETLQKDVPSDRRGDPEQEFLKVLNAATQGFV